MTERKLDEPLDPSTPRDILEEFSTWVLSYEDGDVEDLKNWEDGSFDKFAYTPAQVGKAINVLLETQPRLDDQAEKIR